MEKAAGLQTLPSSKFSHTNILSISQLQTDARFDVLMLRTWNFAVYLVFYAFFTIRQNTHLIWDQKDKFKPYDRLEMLKKGDSLWWRISNIWHICYMGVSPGICSVAIQCSRPSICSFGLKGMQRIAVRLLFPVFKIFVSKKRGCERSTVLGLLWIMDTIFTQ